MKTIDSVDVAAAIREYGARARASLHGDETSAVSYAGLWLLLATLAPVVTDPQGFGRICGLTPEDAKQAATRLLKEPHPTVAIALGGWLREDVQLSRQLPLTLSALPTQDALDDWAKRETRGVVETFPLKLDPDTMLVLASALVLTPKWSSEIALGEDDDMLVLRDGLQAVVQTSIGPVAVARPMTDDGVDVISVIAAPDVAPAKVWDAVDEVVAMLDDGRLSNNTFPGQLSADEVEHGHSWTCQETVRQFCGNAPEEGTEMWEAKLPEWSVTDSHDLGAAPGVDLVAQPIQAMLPERSDLSCCQNVSAKYDEEGFSAAAVTAFGLAGSAPPMPEFRTIRQVTLTFDRPHAVIAIARGGAWDRIPLFHAWVGPKENCA
ncbi:hypothetical protein GCM10011492_06180 [Flexivirga endophytica]|uniref:Serpin domain-containing protein n=1 Tax=Flexivirga endophytica TaxID=1849103 RepID=A0A916WPU9_9MICO|nr:hypothetical protein [Flexivirga endophytica]GGB19070.1 hypothetical protein GCM10011492_06180 [Flexivirga endophytica]GHB36587.1 hypothetical protein GCM10008112_01420 [Flexivirga endophytica]